MTVNTVAPLRIFHLQPGSGVRELAQLPSAPPAQGFYWLACTRGALQEQLASVQAALQATAGLQLVELHVSDLLNAQLPSRYDMRHACCKNKSCLRLTSKRWRPI